LSSLNESKRNTPGEGTRKKGEGGNPSGQILGENRKVRKDGSGKGSIKSRGILQDSEITASDAGKKGKTLGGERGNATG